MTRGPGPKPCLTGRKPAPATRRPVIRDFQEYLDWTEAIQQ